ncbi:hypothetical protein Zmor_005994 [Zophobas morio]|uniref:CCHC-type domain-containing protein n=1 Tax=Zophobas morio TaxID=2755281 RepID=A0AA38IYQ2_9CUCU|nr:hypothetical protein Zmor_005994 [Zophobas morio]
MSQLNTDDIQSLIQQKSSVETTHVLSQETTNFSKKPTRECGTQHNVEDTDVEAIIRRERICKAIDMGSDDEETREVINLKWDEELFTVSLIVNEDIPIEDDVIVIIDKDKKDRDGRMKKIMEKFPQIQDEIEDGALTTGKVTSCISKSGRISEDGSIVYGNEKFIHIIAWHDSQKNIHEIRASLQKVGSLVRNKGRGNIGYMVENPRNEVTIRKMVELTFRREGPHTKFYCRPRGRLKSRSDPGSEDIDPARSRSRNDRTEMVIVRSTGTMTYAQIIQSMKKDVEMKEVRVDSIMKNEKGEVILKVKGGKQVNREGFREDLKNKMRGKAEVADKQRKRTIMLEDLDPTVTEIEVEKVLAEELVERFSAEDTNIRILNKENRSGSKCAFVTMGETEAICLASKKKIGSGWLRWRVKKLVTPPKCSKCKRVGHEMKTYDSTNPSKTCHNCGSLEHMTKDCSNAANCYLCNKEGHRAETMTCPIYKDMVRRMKVRKQGLTPNQEDNQNDLNAAKNEERAGQ